MRLTHVNFGILYEFADWAPFFGYFLNNQISLVGDSAESVDLFVDKCGNDCCIDVRNSECRIEPMFVKERLFRLFDSAKGVEGMGITSLTDSGSHLRRIEDFPVLILSQDYELFFQTSGSIQKCLFEPTDILLDFANVSGIRITFFVDAGMLCRMEQMAPKSSTMAEDLSRIQSHIESLYARGHEIALHVHPHWEDTSWKNGVWQFGGTRYQLRDFSAPDVEEIVTRYTAALNELCDGTVAAFRAGGFCVEPFNLLRKPLLANGITVDSSVVPRARLNDADKGFDFSGAPDKSWWRFNESPVQLDPDGQFLEIPITPFQLPVYHYWGRVIDRVIGRQPSGVIGDGSSKSPGRREIIRRLSGGGRISELSTDVAKARHLVSSRNRRKRRDVWQVMGHPKLLGKSSLTLLQEFIDQHEIRNFQSVGGFASAIRAGEETGDCG